MKHKLFTTLLVMLMSMMGSKAFAHDAEIDGIYYNFSGDEATVTYKGDASDSFVGEYSGIIVIPETVNYNAHTYNVTSIGEKAFSSCSGLTSIEIPGSVTSIDDMVFYHCTNLASIEIPSSVTSISSSAFEFCFGLSSIAVESGNTVYDSRDNCNAIIETNSNMLIAGCKNTVIPSSVTSIGRTAFNGCESLTSIEIPSSVTSIGTGAFLNCIGLTSIEIPSGVTSIGQGAFDNTSWYNKKPNGLVYVGKFAYKYKGTMPSGTSIVLIEGTKGVGESAFDGCTGLTSIEIPNSVTSIGYQAFSYCTGLTSIEIPSSVTNIGNYAFYECTGLTSVEIPNSVTSVGEGTFLNCTDLTSIEIPNSVTSIGSTAFWGCTSLTSIVIPSNVTTIGNSAFLGCTNLTSVTVERETPISITFYVFSNRTNATLYVPRGCKAAYEAADYWKDFKEIKEYGDENATITMGSSGIMTYSNSSDLNFTDVSGLKAYIASGFNPATGNLTMTRVYEVPAGEGLILKGAANSYEVPYEETSAYYANLLVGVPTATTVSPTDGSYTNFILANDAVKGIGFYPLASAGEIGPNKAYLQLPTSILPPASARQFRMVFEDEEDVTGINSLNEKGAMRNEKFDLQGRRVVKPTRGLYIKDGKKIMVK